MRDSTNRKTANTLRSVLFGVFILTIGGSGHAQHSSIMLKGIITSNVDKTALPGATVLLRTPGDSIVAATTTSASDGRFELGPLTPGAYVLQLNMVGFSPVRKLVTLNASTDLGVIALAERETLLKSVEVTGQRMLIESRPGMITYNVSADAMAIGKSLGDIATTLPGIAQNGSGALTYGGDNQVTVLVNGRKSNINPVDIMNQIQPANVERLELITGADPRFASSTGAATINIVMKKNKESGVNGNAVLSLNHYGFINGSLNINRFSGRTNLYAAFSNDDRWLRMKTEYGRKNMEADTFLFTGRIDNRLHHALRTVTMGADFYPDSLNVITLENNVSFHGDDMDAVNNWTSEGAATTSRVRSFPHEWENTLSLNHQRKFRKPGQWMETEVSGTLFTMQNKKTFGEDRNAERQTLDNRALRFRSEFTLPVNRRSSLSTGIDFSRIDAQNKSLLFQRESEVIASEEFEYKTQRSAVYGAYTFRLSDVFSLRPGLRLENARTTAKEINLPGNAFDLTTLYPTMNMVWEPGAKHTFTADYIRKIQYPNLYTLYTLPNQADTFNLHSGNGRLVPAIRNEGSVSHRYVASTFNFTTRLYAHIVKNAILPYTFVEGDRMITASENLGDLASYGGSFSFSVSKTPVWKLNSGTNFSFSEITPRKTVYLASEKLYSFSAFVTNQFHFNKKISTEISLRMMNFTRNVTERYDPMYNLSCQFSYTARAGWVYSVMANDVLFTMVNRGTIFPHPSLSHRTTFIHRSRFIQASVRLKFGKAARGRNRKLENEKIQFSNG